MHEKSHIIVTPKGCQLQSQILKETISDFPLIISPKANPQIRSNRTKGSPSPLASPTSLSAYALPRSGYFGPPKDQHIASTNTSPKALRFFPNYMNKEATECPPRHFCLWKPESTAPNKKDIPPEIPKGKYIHHTLYNLAIDTKLAENPSIHGLNRAAFGKNEKAKEILVAETFENWDDIDVMKRSIERSEKDMHRSYMNQTSGGTINMFGSTGFSMIKSNSSNFRSTGFSSKPRGSVFSNDNREERLFRKHWEGQKNYEQMLARLGGEVKKKKKKFEENQHEAPEFLEKMDSLNGTIEGIDAKQYNEDARYVKRLKEYHQQKYEKVWTANIRSVGHSPEPSTMKKEAERGLGIKRGALYHVTAGRVAQNKESQNVLQSLKMKRKKKLAVAEGEGEEEKLKTEVPGEGDKQQGKQENLADSRIVTMNDQLIRKKTTLMV